MPAKVWLLRHLGGGALVTVAVNQLTGSVRPARASVLVGYDSQRSGDDGVLADPPRIAGRAAVYAWGKLVMLR